MATGVGLRIAEDECIAAIVAGGGDSEDSAEPFYITRESVLHMSDDGDTALGGAAPPGHSHSIRGFVSAIGDPAGITVDDGEAYRAEDLVATAVFCLINLAADHLNGPSEFYATHPADWPAQYVRGLREALNYLGLRSVVLVSEGNLPAAEDGRGHARNAARAALAAVLSTPAGATPPDPAGAENALVVTDVLPAVPASAATMQAYSAAMPVPAAVPEPEAMTVAATAAAPIEPVPPEPRRGHRTPLLIAAVAVLVGLILGGVAAAMVLRDDGSTTRVPPTSGAAEANTLPPTTAVPPPTPEPVTVAPQPPQEEYTEAPTTTTVPSPTPSPTPATTTPAPSSSESTSPTTTAPSTTRHRPRPGTGSSSTTPDPYSDVPGFSWPSGVPYPWESTP
ncbi:hypothetical protein NONO_c72850 [Nocardia nova SH22a]|uniref:Uncharacterized protein n=1 Tax=Nocardia nova SH22a TaxID=1415166 RepID=W5TRY9_9NOCA|nr:hypothetical protein [Nocardia nova]AHH22042.1 hypothetical protein NONO_c72850 [Nocardia nova SH22a]